MSVNLINVNVDQLFEQHGVAEIDIIQKKIQTEVEHKREELRTMVGERYRDLLKAADTITSMKNSSEVLVTQMEKINLNCKSLNERQLIGFQTEPKVPAHLNRIANKQINNYFSTVVQIKLLMNLSESIWSLLDKEEFFTATQLFIFARHISTGLQLDVNNSLMQYFPVAKKQWEMLKPFFFTIKQSCLTVLEREELSSQQAIDCLLSLFLLEKANMDKILKTFTELRSNALLKSLEENKRRVKDRILTSLDILNSTVELICKCFIGERGLLVHLEKMLSSEAPCTLSYLEINDKELCAVLPDIIAKFKPTFEAPTINMETSKQSIEDWLFSISEISKNQLKNNFELITSMKIIQEIKQEALQIKKPKEWDLFCDYFGHPKGEDFYESKYRPLINHRIRAIVHSSWLKCSEEVFETIVKGVEINSKEFSISVWTESESDVPQSLNDLSNRCKISNILLMKSKGFSQEIVEIVSKFDTKLKDIVGEVEILVNESNSSNEDKVTLIDFLKETSELEVCNLITKLKSLKVENRKQDFLFLGRVLLAFVELCPNLKECLSTIYSENEIWEGIVVNKKNFEKWNRISGLIMEESFFYWRNFCDILLEECNIKKVFHHDMGYDVVLKDFLNWESISIEESTTIRVPFQPRVALQQYLDLMSTSLNVAVPQTLPNKVLLHLNTKIIENLLSEYETVSKSKFVLNNQNTALQLYFDIKFIQTIFIKREDKNMFERSQKIYNSLKELIDPFDFELFHSHLNNNIKKCIQRMKTQLGVLIPYPENIALLGTAGDHKISGYDKDPNVLSLSSNGSNSSWFPLLPIIVAEDKDESNSAVFEEKPQIPAQMQPTAIKPKKSPRSGGAQRQTKQSGAASFFGAMSQEWFK